MKLLSLTFISFISLFIHLLLLQNVEGKFLSEQYVTDGLDAPKQPAILFFYNSNLISAISILNGDTLNYKASLVQYSSTGTIVQNLTLPLACEAMYCNIEVTYAEIQSNILYLLVNADGCCSSFRFAVYEIDLDSFEILSEVNYKPNILTGNFYPQAWLNYNTTTTFWASINSLGLIEANPFDFADFNILNQTTPLLLNYAYYGGSSPQLAENDLLMVCGSNQFIYELQLYNLQSEEYLGKTILKDGCGFARYLGDSPNIVISASGTGIGLTILDLLNEKLPVVLPQTEIYLAGYSTGILADSSNLFISTRLYSDQRNSTILQIAVDSSSEDPFSILDEYPVEVGYTAPLQNYGNILSLGLDSTDQRVAFLLGSSDGTTAILVLTYDNTSNN